MINITIILPILLLALALLMVVYRNDRQNKQQREQYIQRLQQAERSLLHANQLLEETVQARMKEVQNTNERLTEEVRERRLIESLLAHNVKIADEARNRAEEANRKVVQLAADHHRFGVGRSVTGLNNGHGLCTPV